MTFADSVAADMNVLDGLETVIVTNAAGVSLTVTGVLGRDIRQPETSMIGGSLGMAPRRRDFHLPVAALEGMTLTGGDLITTADNARWRIQSVQLAAFSTRLHATCTAEF